MEGPSWSWSYAISAYHHWSGWGVQHYV